MTIEKINDAWKLDLSGRIDSNNAGDTEKEIQSLLADKGTCTVILDMQDLEYVSSAGLRSFLRLKKQYPDIHMINVSADVYDVLQMTGFTEIMTVEKAYRTVSVEGCEEIGRGANGSVYRIDQDNVVKVYRDADALEDIRHEREVARLALVLGIPTAISYDVVKVGDSYGSVFELLNAFSFSKILSSQPEKMDWCVREYVKMLKKIHTTLVPEGKLPEIKDTVLNWVHYMEAYLPPEAYQKLLSLVEAVPKDNHMIHGDYHTKNLVLQGDEVLLIDMDTLAVGHPIFELGSMYNAFIGFSEVDHEIIRKFQGFDYETSHIFWHKTLAAYLGTENEAIIKDVEDKARIIGYTRLIRRAYRRNAQETPEGQADINHWTKELLELLDKTDTLMFLANELIVEADTENLSKVQAFVEQHLEGIDCPMRVSMQISLAVEEIFVNIANYAYAPGKGQAIIRVEVTGNPKTITITFLDSGVPYDPLQKEDPDVMLSADQRPIGGLGIFITKQAMDDLAYEYKDGHNILKLKKNLI